jgi:hypothetical protein
MSDDCERRQASRAATHTNGRNMMHRKKRRLRHRLVVITNFFLVTAWVLTASAWQPYMPKALSFEEIFAETPEYLW